MMNLIGRAFSSISQLIGSGSSLQREFEQTLTTMHDALLEADVPLEAVRAFIASLKQKTATLKVPAGVKPSDYLTKLVYDELVGFLGSSEDKKSSFVYPTTVMVLGLQGSGKTTTAAKLAYYWKQVAGQRGKKRTILLGSVDFYRPAAIDQLQIMAERADVSFYKATQTTDPVAAAEEIQKYARSRGYDLLILDTAGRLHIDEALCKELQLIDQKLKPAHKYLVLDSMTGQQSLAVARSFQEQVGFSAAIMTKMDSDTRGGAAFSFAYSLQKPILFAGYGEKLDELEQFKPDRVAARMMGLGDVQTLVEKVQQKIDASEQQSLYNALHKGDLTLELFAKQMEMVGKLGSLTSLARYVPGLSGLKVSQEDLERGERELKKFKAIISSMTKKERQNPRLLDNSRKNRVAKGAGVSEKEVGEMLAKFEQTKQFVKMMKSTGGIDRFYR
jgi:signal recognition particle subunit SRP54